MNSKLTRRRRITSLLAVATIVPLFAAASGTLMAEDATATARVRATIDFLASDDLEGRGVGTDGLNRAADYLAERFAELGLATDHYDGTPFQVFQMSTGAELGDQNFVAVAPPAGDEDEPQRDLELGKDYTPMPLGGSDVFDLPLVFAGYGITAPDEGYDDYADVDVTDKAVVILRHEPQQDNPHSVFDGTRTSEHAPFTRKISNAYEHGAAAVVFCTDEHELLKRLARRRRRLNDRVQELAEAAAKLADDGTANLTAIAEQAKAVDELLEGANQRAEDLRDDLDPLLPFSYTSSQGESRDLPVLFFRRKVIDDVLRSIDKPDLAALEKQIDEGPTPVSFELGGYRITGETAVDRNEVDVKNVVAVLEGEGPHAD